MQRVRAWLWKHAITLGVVLLCLAYAFAGSIININRYWQFDLGYYDFGFFDKAIWSVSRFQTPITDHLVFPGKIIFADHFNPSIFLFAPLYWITSRSEALLIASSFVVATSGFVLYAIGMRLLKSSFASAGVVVAYLFFVGLQNAVYSDFHELTVMTLFLMLTYWALFAGRKRLFIVFFLLTLGFKESLFLLGVGISFFLYFYRKEWRGLALFLFFFSLAYGFVTIRMLIPFFSGGRYNSTPILADGLFGLMRQLVSPTLKIQTVFLSLLSFSFLPLLTPSLLPLLALNFVHRFLMPGSTRWDLGLHYNAEIAPTLAVMTVLSLVWIARRFHNRKVLILLSALVACVSLFLHRFVLHGPISLAVHPAFYQTTRNNAYIARVVATVPKDVRVAAQNNLVPPFLHQDVVMLRDEYKKQDAEYIVIDLRPGQKPSNFMGIQDPQALLTNLRNDSHLKVVFHEGDAWVFKQVR